MGYIGTRLQQREHGRVGTLVESRNKSRRTGIQDTFHEHAKSLKYDFMSKSGKG